MIHLMQLPRRLLPQRRFGIEKPAHIKSNQRKKQAGTDINVLAETALILIQLQRHITVLHTLARKEKNDRPRTGWRAGEDLHLRPAGGLQRLCGLFCAATLQRGTTGKALSPYLERVGNVSQIETRPLS